MGQFLLTLFIGERYREYRLNSIQAYDFVQDVQQFFENQELSYDQLFSEENGRWYIQTNDKQNIAIQCNGTDVKHKQIEHGDFFLIRDYDHNLAFELLLLDLQQLQLNFAKYELPHTVRIGRLSDSDIHHELNNSISRTQAQIRRDGHKVIVENLSDKIGVYVNGQLVSYAELTYGDTIYVMGLKVVYFEQFIAVNNVAKQCRLQPFTNFIYAEAEERTRDEKYFTRSPRIMKTPESGTFEIDPPPAKAQPKDTPLLLTMGPSLTMAMAMLVSLGLTISNARTGANIGTSLTMAISMLIGAIVWPLAMHRYQKRQEVKEEKHRVKRYREYIHEQRLLLEEKKQRNMSILNDHMYPAPEQMMNFVHDEEARRRLWEKTPDNLDYLDVRLGTGRRPFELDIQTAKKGFVLHEDELLDEPQRIAAEYEFVDDVPITVSLRDHQLLGVIGARRRTLNNMNCMALGIAGQHAYDEVKMVFVYNEQQAEQLSWVRELPHVWSADRSLRFVATNRDEVHQLFLALNEELKEREQRLLEDGNKGKVALTKYIFFIADHSLVENEPLLRYLLNPHNIVEVTSIFAARKLEQLPKDCDVIIQNDEKVSGVYYKHKHDNHLIEFTEDEIAVEQLHRFAQKLSQLKVRTSSISLDVPESITFLGMFKAGNIEELNIRQRWAKQEPYKSLDVPIGIKAGGELFSLDIHENYHGPHGLVAGMTGAGKSEFLQAYIISAAINFHPHDLSFVLIDYKGGGMANVFDGMPHIAGKITNLSGSQLNRSLISIEAEIKKRQYLLSEYGVNHVDKYQKLYKEGIAKEPLPHLVIISDEFAQLKTQQPDFMRKLIDVAQIGRSLGVHLILATQKPAGVVDDQIWGNSRFRVCLKVLDKYDSNEMIRKPDAALIKQPGRCYVQVGYDEVYELVQSGYSGVDYAPTDGFIDQNSLTVEWIDSTATTLRKAKVPQVATKTGKSELEELVNYLIDVKRADNIKPMALWLEPLKEILFLSELEGYAPYDGTWNGTTATLRTLVGLADFPGSQQQRPVDIDFLRDGHLLIYGASGTGKTTLLQTLLYGLAEQYSPEQVQFYIFDFAARTLGFIGQAPHTHDVAYADDEEKVSDILDDLFDTMEERKRLFAEHNVGSYTAFLTSAKQQLPAIVVAIDNYSVLRDRFYSQEDKLVPLVANSKTYGIYFIITGNSKSAVFYKVTEHISRTIALRLNDPHDYRDVLNTPVHGELDDVAGRGYIVADEVAEFQVALVGDIEDEAERVQFMQRQYKQMAEQVETPLPKRERRERNEQEDDDEVTPRSYTTARSATKTATGIRNTLPKLAPSEHALAVGTLVKSGEEQAIALQHLHSFYIGGPAESGKTDYFKQLVMNIQRLPDHEIVLIDRENEELADFAKQCGINQYVTTADSFDHYVDQLEDIVKERLADYEMMCEAIDDEEVRYGYMQRYHKLFICINGFQSFFDMITDEALERFTFLVDKARQLNIYFVIEESNNISPEYTLTDLYILLLNTENRILLGNAGVEWSIPHVDIDALTSSGAEILLVAHENFAVLGR